MQRTTCLLVLLLGPLADIALCADDAAPPGHDRRIFRTVDEQGHVVFTDRAPAGTREVKPDEPQHYRPLPVTPTPITNPATNTDTTAPVPSYRHLAITGPVDKTTIRDNGGRLHVTGTLTPPLAAGHRLQLLVNGAVLAEARQPDFTLDDVPRGAQTLRLRIVDERGRIVRDSRSLTVYLFRASVLHPQRRRSAP